jgi:hypothetical protein
MLTAVLTLRTHLFTSRTSLYGLWFVGIGQRICSFGLPVYARPKQNEMIAALESAAFHVMYFVSRDVSRVDQTRFDHTNSAQRERGGTSAVISREMAPLRVSYVRQRRRHRSSSMQQQQLRDVHAAVISRRPVRLEITVRATTRTPRPTRDTSRDTPVYTRARHPTISQRTSARLSTTDDKHT